MSPLKLSEHLVHYSMKLSELLVQCEEPTDINAYMNRVHAPSRLARQGASLAEASKLAVNYVVGE